MTAYHSKSMVLCQEPFQAKKTYVQNATLDKTNQQTCVSN